MHVLDLIAQAAPVAGGEGVKTLIGIALLWALLGKAEFQPPKK